MRWALQRKERKNKTPCSGCADVGAPRIAERSIRYRACPAIRCARPPGTPPLKGEPQKELARKILSLVDGKDRSKPKRPAKLIMNTSCRLLPPRRPLNCLRIKGVHRRERGIQTYNLRSSWNHFVGKTALLQIARFPAKWITSGLPLREP